MAYKIDQSKCLACRTCAGVCPMSAITTDASGKCKIDPQKCVSCGTCAAMCPANAISSEN